MAYTEPALRSTDEKITAAIWNADLRDNFIDHEDRINNITAPSGDDYEKLISSTTETTMASWTISAGDMGTDGFYYIHARFLAYNDTGGGYTLTVKCKLGSTTFFSSGAQTVNSGAVYSVRDMLFCLQNKDNAAVNLAITSWGYADSMSAASLATASPRLYFQTGTENTAGDLTAAITCQLSVNNANAWVEMAGAMLTGPINP